ncbi:hypothetical protein, partial [Methylobacterium sp. WL12]|uniref:hypothetical protein n=1 Tax=Methylobacterium sp. WL12 TaxID=2603890 RepID=UPI001AED8D5C
RAWGFRHAGLCGWASRMGMVDDPKYSASPLLAEAIALRAELQRLADETRPKTDYYRGDL